MNWLIRLFRKDQAERHLDAELHFHLERQISDYITEGMTPEEAQLRASRKVSEPSPNYNVIVGHIRQPPFDTLF